MITKYPQFANGTIIQVSLAKKKNKLTNLIARQNDVNESRNKAQTNLYKQINPRCFNKK